jgi:uncharacterized membrane protein YdjX (TVP38/TMEM64 family)
MPEGKLALQAPPKPEGRGLPWTRILVGVAVLAGLLMLRKTVGGYVPRFATWVDSLGSLGPLVFVIGYVCAVVAFVPGSIPSLLGGAIFGLEKGVVLVFLAATLGASLAFLVSRHLVRASIERRIAGNPRFAAIDRAIGHQGRRIVFLLRLSPVFPFSLLNYALGLTRVRFGDYVVASVGMLPGTLLFVYYGHVLGLAAALAGGTAHERGAAEYAVLGLGLAATIVVTTLVTRIARRALAEATGEKV